MLAASPEPDAEEWAIHDYEGFEGANLSEYASFETVCELADFIEEHGELGGKLLEHFGDDLAEARAVFDEYAGEYRSAADFAEQLHEDTGTQIPESLRYYIDWQALEAAKRAAPRAFSHYYDRNELVSANMMKNLRNRALLKTPNHKVYSLRHAFEKRMQEANIDYGLRCLLMGHKPTRPAYGDGGSLEYRRDELLKIAHPFDPRVMEQFERENPEWAVITPESTYSGYH